MPRKGIPRPRDKNLDCLAVIIYREIIHLQLNHIQRAEVAEKVECNERGLRIWRATLIEHMMHGWNPKNVPFLIKQWENSYYNGIH